MGSFYKTYFPMGYIYFKGLVSKETVVLHLWLKQVDTVDCQWLKQVQRPVKQLSEQDLSKECKLNLELLHLIHIPCCAEIMCHGGNVTL